MDASLYESRARAARAAFAVQAATGHSGARNDALNNAARIRRLRRWGWIHKWSSLVCTVFLLVICLTGLPLVFSEEIDHWLEPRAYDALPADAPRKNLDDLVARSRQHYPGEVITSIFIDDDEPQTIVALAPSWATLHADPKSSHFMRFDSRSGRILENTKPLSEQSPGFMGVMFSLHTDLFVGLSGELFLGTMALLFVVAIVSGVVLYEPFMRRLKFGTVRRDRSPRLKWLDLHNLLGIATLAWAFVVGATGVINELSTPLFGLWRLTEVQAILQPWRGQSPPPKSQLSAVQPALDNAQRAVPGMTITSIIFPGSDDGSPHHYVIWAKGSTPLRKQLFSPILVDARTGAVTAVVRMPWYLRALEISRPLHFGDYGGTPLKIIWALLDGITIVVLGSGLYLWLVRRKSPVERRLENLEIEAGSRAAGSRASAAVR